MEGVELEKLAHTELLKHNLSNTFSYRRAYIAGYNKAKKENCNHNFIKMERNPFTRYKYCFKCGITQKA